MSRKHCEQPALPGQITFLCQQCHGDLELTAEKFADDPVWRCRRCPAGWIWTLAGWGRLPSWGK